MLCDSSYSARRMSHIDVLSDRSSKYVFCESRRTEYTFGDRINGGGAGIAVTRRGTIGLLLIGTLSPKMLLMNCELCCDMIGLDDILL